MPDASKPLQVWRFGVFEVDLRRKELHKDGLKVRIQEQPFEVLVTLLERPGEVISREELRARIWGDTFVDFEHSLSVAVSKLRDALSDSSDSPRFIETVPRKGYRFIAPVEVADAAAIPPPEPVAGKRRLWLLAAAGLAVVAVTVGWFLSSSRKGSETPGVPVPLTSYRGDETCPSFVPDGSQVAFQWCPEGLWSGKNCDIYIKQIGVETPFRLTNTPVQEFGPAWSPDGRTIAFLRQLSASSATLVVTPQRGGRERVLAEFDTSKPAGPLDGPYLAWTPDSKWLVCPVPERVHPEKQHWVLYLFSVETGERRRLTSPPTVGDTTPAISPDGHTLAFARDARARTDLFLLPLGEDYRPEGEPERIPSENRYNSGAAWTPDGGGVVFASSSGGRGDYRHHGMVSLNISSCGLWRVSASNPGRPRALPFAQEFAIMPAVSKQGRRLAYVALRSDTNIWRVDPPERGHQPSAPEQLIASTRWDYEPEFSPDGKRIAFVSNRSGTMEIWVCDGDGSNPAQLTSLGGTLAKGPKWSPDGKKILLYAAPEGRSSDVYAISANGGELERLTTDPAPDRWPYWSRDGQWIYFVSHRTGVGEIWKMAAGGGDAAQITHVDGADLPHESPDGRFVYFSKGFPYPQSVWMVPISGGEATKVLDGVHYDGSWTVGSHGIYYFTVPGEDGRSDLMIYEFATRKTTRILTIDRPVSMLPAISPDGRTILYAQIDDAGSDLMLVENFR